MFFQYCLVRLRWVIYWRFVLYLYQRGSPTIKYCTIEESHLMEFLFNQEPMINARMDTIRNTGRLWSNSYTAGNATVKQYNI